MVLNLVATWFHLCLFCKSPQLCTRFLFEPIFVLFWVCSKSRLGILKTLGEMLHWEVVSQQNQYIKLLPLKGGEWCWWCGMDLLVIFVWHVLDSKHVKTNKQILNWWRVFACMMVFRVFCTLDCMNLRGHDLKIHQRLQREVSERNASCLSDSFAFWFKESGMLLM